MRKHQSIVYLRYPEGEDGLGNNEAQDKRWAKVLASPDTTILEGHGESAVILVHTGHIIQGLRQRSLESAASRPTDLESQKQAEEAMVKMTSTGAGSAALTALGQAGAFFHPLQPTPTAETAHAGHPS